MQAPSNESGESSTAAQQEGTVSKTLFTWMIVCLSCSSLIRLLFCCYNTGAGGSSSEKGTHMTGIYDLVSVLTHKGRSADSGHYVAWVKQESG